MCETCSFVETVFKAAKSNPHWNYSPVLALLGKMEEQGRIVLAAGDCPIDETASVLNSEMHYTVVHYFQCNECGKYFFIGACIRGTPIFDSLEYLEPEKINRQVWGKLGTFFSKS